MVSNNYTNIEKNEYRKKLTEEYEDSFLRLVMYDYEKQEGELLLKENEEIKNDPQYEPSADLVKRFNKLLKKNFRKQKLISFAKKSQKILSRVGIFIFAFAVLFAVMFSTVSAFRIQVLNLLLTFEDEYMSVRLDGDSNNTEDISNIYFHNIYAPSYIPEGYWLNNFSNGKSFKMIEYINDNENLIQFFEFNSTMNGNIDTEDAQTIKPIKINGSDGMLVIKNETITISWAYENRGFVLSAQMSEEEIVKIAESTVFIK